ncbi:MAG TPA: transglutaminase-like domain-containing protein [Gemmatimonadales bacterium]
MTRGAWAVTVFTAWGVGVGWLVKREFFKPTAARLADAARAIPPGATYYRLDVGDRQVGFASSTLDTLGDSIRVDEVLEIEVPALGRIHRTRARSRAVVGRTLRLRSLDVRFDGDQGEFDARGEVFGDSVLRLLIRSAADSHWTRLRLPRPVVLPALLPLRLAFGGELRTGTTRTVRLFDPLLLTERDVRVTVAGESTLVVADSADFDSTAMAWVPVLFDTVPTFRFDIVSDEAVTSIWVDAQGRVIRSKNAFGFTVQRSAFEIAYENFRRRDTARALAATARPAVGDIVPSTAVAAGVRLPPGEGPQELRLRVSGVDRSGLGWASGRQRLRGDTVVIRRESDAALRAAYRLPAAADSLMAPWLAAEPLIQSENPRIRSQARLLAGRERDPGRVAERILRWVHTEVRKAPVRAAPSAVEVFESRAGDCNEHTVLYVALARAAGLPARPVAGLIYLNDRFYYHAWPEVYLGEWVAVDPTLGQFPADAARLRLTTGGLARQVELLRLVGTVELEVL